MNETKEKRIDEKEVLNELRSMIRENYVLLIEEAQGKENAFVLRYLNGQKFLLELKEIEA
ncbi:MAG: hypothetical protein IJX91_04795 [Clostridia bacterium]|nr:hypothetical protein [Clostridia bacterium]